MQRRKFENEKIGIIKNPFIYLLIYTIVTTIIYILVLPFVIEYLGGCDYSFFETIQGKNETKNEIEVYDIRDYF